MKQFKEGDWVRNGNRIFKYSYNDLKYDIINPTHGINDELWKPRKGEWFWFCPDKDCPPTLTRLDSFSRIGSMSKIYCEPFIGELPKFLKEVT